MVKKYEFERDWQGKATSTSDVSSYLLDNPTIQAMGQLDLATSKALREATLSALEQCPEITKISVEPTAWDIELERWQPPSFRVKEAVWFAGGGTIKAAVELMIALLALVDPTRWQSLLVPGGSLAKLIYRLLHAYVQLEGVDCDVFEAVHRLGLRHAVVNYDALRDGDWERAYGLNPPTSEEVMTNVKADPGSVRESLAALAKRDIIKRRGDGRWIIRF
jgi:hypothetical protein